MMDAKGHIFISCQQQFYNTLYCWPLYSDETDTVQGSLSHSTPSVQGRDRADTQRRMAEIIHLITHADFSARERGLRDKDTPKLKTFTILRLTPDGQGSETQETTSLQSPQQK